MGRCGERKVIKANIGKRKELKRKKKEREIVDRI